MGLGSGIELGSQAIPLCRQCVPPVGARIRETDSCSMRLLAGGEDKDNKYDQRTISLASQKSDFKTTRTIQVVGATNYSSLMSQSVYTVWWNQRTC